MDNPVQTFNQEQPSGNKFLPIILIFFGLVILVLLAEGGYIVYNNYLKQSLPNIEVGKQETQEESLSPTSEPPVKIGGQLRPEKAAEFTEMLRVLKEGGKDSFFQQAKIDLLYSGIVSEVGPEAREINGVNYIYFMRFYDEKTDKSLNLLFTNEDLSSASVKLIEDGGTLRKINVQEIKPGDKVTMMEKINLLDSPPLSQLSLIVER